MKSEFLLIAKRLMETEQRPMSARELVDLGHKQQLFSDNIAGRTPFQTMKSKLSVHIRRFGDASPFIRTGPGRFYLRALLGGNKAPFDATPVRPPRIREKVLVFPREQLDAVTTWQGLQTKWKKPAKTILTRLKPQYMNRFDVEQDNEFTQIVTYVLVCRGESILSYRRGTYNRVEKFLQGALCVGFGGHVVHTDLNLFNESTLGIFACASRELTEELDLPTADKKRLRRGEGVELVGIINDDSSDVGRRHLAFVMRYSVTSDPCWDRPERGEKAITQLKWISAKGVEQLSLWNFEYWSQLCLREFAPRLVRVGPAFRVINRRPLRPPHLLCIIGPVGSGKTLATEVLRNDYGYDEINTGRVVAELVGVPPVPETPRSQFQEMAWRLVTAQDGIVLLASRLAALAEATHNPRILVDGIRQRATLESLRAVVGTRRLGVVFVHTPADLAYSFYSERIHQGASMAEFIALRTAPVEAEVEGLIGIADAVLYNWTGRLKYREAIRTMMTDLGIPEI